MAEETARHLRLDAARQLSGMSTPELWWRYFGLGGRLTEEELSHFLTGERAVDLDDEDVLAHALNERFAEADLDHPVPYSDAGEALGGGPSVDEARLAAHLADLVPRLTRMSSRLTPDALAPLVADEARRAGLPDVSVLLVDAEQQALTPLPPGHAHAVAAVDGTMAGRAFQTERAVAAARESGGWTIWLPLLDGAERLGVLQVRSDLVSDEIMRRLDDLAHGVAELITAKSTYGDTLVLARRRREMTLSAEMRWPVLPPLTFTSDKAGIACVLEPAYDVAGDAFDYAANHDLLHFAIFDAMGHGLEATEMASLALGAYRASRRQGLGLAHTVRRLDRVIADEFGNDRFVTAQLATLHCDTGVLRWLSAGHPHPLLLRRGRLASELVTEPCLPLGMGGDLAPEAEFSLEPGDHLLFFTDGVVEARSPGGERFGQERLVDLTIRALADHQTLAETARRLVRSVQLHRDGPLQDDATIMFVHWGP